MRKVLLAILIMAVSSSFVFSAQTRSKKMTKAERAKIERKASVKKSAKTKKRAPKVSVTNSGRYQIIMGQRQFAEGGNETIAYVLDTATGKIWRETLLKTGRDWEFFDLEEVKR